MDVGNKTLIKKDIGDTKKVIEEQIKKLMEGKNQVLNKMQEIQAQTEHIINEAEKSQK